MTYRAFKNGPLWTLDECDVNGIGEHFLCITTFLLQDEYPEMKKLAFRFREIEALAKHAAECIENGGPEPGEDEIKGYE